MSVKQMGIVWDLDLPHNQAWVLMALLDHADHDGGQIYPSVDLVAWKTGYAPRQIQRIIKELVAAGILEVTAEARQHRPTEYRASLAHVPRKEPLRSDKTSPLNKSSGDKMSPRKTASGDKMSPQQARPRGDISSARGDISSARGDIAMSPEPPHEPSHEPSDLPPPHAESASPGGGGDATVRLLLSAGVITAAEFPDIPLDVAQAAIDQSNQHDEASRKRGQLVNGLLKRFRAGNWVPPAPAVETAPARDPNTQLRAALKARLPTSPAAGQAPARASPGPDRQLASLWQAAQGQLRAQLAAGEFDTWLRRLEISGLAEGVATLTAPSAEIADGAQRRHGTVIRRVLGDLAGAPLQLHIVAVRTAAD